MLKQNNSWWALLQSMPSGRDRVVGKAALMTFWFLASLTTLSACKSEQSSGVSDIPSLNATPTPTPTPTPPPGSGGSGPSEGNFKITTSFPFSGITGYLHQESDWNSACEISPTETVQAKKDITCVFDVNELDLYFNTVDVNISVPKGVCDYVTIQPYWFYKAQPGVGPTTVEATQDANGVLTINSPTDGTVLVRNNSISCAYDYSAEDGPNCCSGDYSGTLNVISTGTTTTSTISGSWGGKIGNCAAGPGADEEHWSRSAAENIPLADVWYTNDGLTYSYPVKSPISQQFGTNLSSANWVNNHASATLPMPLRATGIQSVYRPQLYHTFKCLDFASEVKMQARLLIREWNLLSELNKKSSGDPDAGTGTETNFPGESENDFRDWNDYLNSVYPGHSGL